MQYLKKTTYLVAVMLVAVLLIAGINPKNVTEAQRIGITNMLHDYTLLIHKNDMNKVVEFTYPKMFKYVSKADIKRTFLQMVNNEKIKFTFGDMCATKFNNAAVHEGIEYVWTDYSLDLTMQYKNVTPEEAEQLENGVLKALQTNYGEKNVTLDPNTYTFKVRSLLSMIAINDPDIGAWRFIEKQNATKSIYDSILPAAVRNEF